MRLDAGFLERAAVRAALLLFLVGAFEGRAYEAEVLSYEGPFGVGYLVATFMPSESEEQMECVKFVKQVFGRLCHSFFNKKEAIKYEENIFHLGIGHGGASG